MAPRTEHSDNVVFLFKCIESTGVKIDFSKAGPALGIKANAARMRYIRLRKAVEGSLGASITMMTSSTAQNAAATDDGAVIGKSGASKKRKRQKKGGKDQQTDLVATTGDEEDGEMEQDSGKPSTRGVKVDYSAMLVEAESSSITGSDGLSSEFVDDNAISQYEKTPVKVKTPVRAAKRKIQQTPPPSSKSVKQMSMLSDVGLDEGVRDSAANLTPPSTVKRRQHILSHSPASGLDEESRADFVSLRCGQRVSGSTFKKRKTNPVVSDNLLQASPERARKMSPTDLTEYPPSDASLRTHNGLDINEADVPQCSVVPDDSISMTNQQMARHNNVEMHGGMPEKTLMQRITQFWR